MWRSALALRSQA